MTVPTAELDLESPDSYLQSVRRLADSRLSSFACAEEVGLAADDLNAYPGRESLGPPSGAGVLEDEGTDLAEAGRRAVLEGRIFWEHTAAGEATRLGLGPKYFIAPGLLERRLAASGGPPPGGGLLPLELGRRHLVQLAYEIRRLADESGIDPDLAMARQRMLLVVPEEGMPAMAEGAARDLAGLMPRGSLLFMIQTAFHGLEKGTAGWAVDPRSPRRLHNHGYLAMQKTMEGQVFRLDGSGRRAPLSREAFLGLLGEAWDLVSYNIEDLGYLTAALDLETAGMAVGKRSAGYGMMMEVIPNNPERPIKGGMYAFDPALGRDVVVESLRLKGVGPGDIGFLNKNFNHYLEPASVFGRIREEGLYMPVSVRDGRLYFQPVQGDISFWARTFFFTRRKASPINSLKSPLDIPSALEAMRLQDVQPGFAELASGLAR
ncbi:MAG: hypothetical protein LBG06_01595 [Deltaproteobacteria bacterium]|jgi:hypothetical protein|nr:hypothetical protein [Deltaproteobacteria bacterium]